MRSKTSFFNKTIYRKNLTRFAPVWGVYTLCLTLGVLLLYSNGGSMKQFHFANNFIGDMFTLLAIVNLGYALLVAQLLFGDLYNSRMCNMLHAFPVSRESWFVTNMLSGFTFSLVPTAVMALVAAPLLMGSLFDGAAMLAFWAFLASNLQFTCFFGLAAFAAMCTANRFTMAAGYGLLNAGAMIAYWLVDTVYTPMLYGVITPTQLMYNLTPMYHVADRQFARTEFSLYQLQEQYGDKLEGVHLTFSLTEEWWHLWLVAGVGVVFLMLALVLYKKRQLECAGDAVAFRFLVPVFEVLCAVFVTTAASYILENFLYIIELRTPTLIIGLVVGWFVAKMLIERTTRVFRLKNFYGLALLTAVFGVSLALTHFDVFGIEDYIPAPAKVHSVFFETGWTRGRDLKTTVEIEDMQKLHRLALQKPVEESGAYVRGLDGSWVRYQDINDHLYDVVMTDHRVLEKGERTYVAEVGLTYQLNSGKIVKRRYNIWVDSEEGRLTNQYLNNWAELDWDYVENDVTYSRKELVLENLRYFNVNYQDEENLPEICFDEAAAQELLSCMERDMAEGHMAPHPYFHSGLYRREEKKATNGYVATESRTITFYGKYAGKELSWSVDLYPDAIHTVRFLTEQDLMENWEVRLDQQLIW